MVERVTVTGRERPWPRGVQVRDVTRRLPPVLAAGLALMATAAGWPAAPARPAHTAVTTSYVRAGLGTSDAVLQLPGYPRLPRRQLLSPACRLDPGPAPSPRC